MAEIIFNKSEINILIQALEAWENEAHHAKFMSELFKTMFKPKHNEPPDAQVEYERKAKWSDEHYEKDYGDRKEVSTLLKAKLIQCRQVITAKNILDVNEEKK